MFCAYYHQLWKDVKIERAGKEPVAFEFFIKEFPSSDPSHKGAYPFDELYKHTQTLFKKNCWYIDHRLDDKETVRAWLNGTKEVPAYLIRTLLKLNKSAEEWMVRIEKEILNRPSPIKVFTPHIRARTFQVCNPKAYADFLGQHHLYNTIVSQVFKRMKRKGYTCISVAFLSQREIEDFWQKYPDDGSRYAPDTRGRIRDVKLLQEYVPASFLVEDPKAVMNELDQRDAEYQWLQHYGSHEAANSNSFCQCRTRDCLCNAFIPIMPPDSVEKASLM